MGALTTLILLVPSEMSTIKSDSLGRRENVREKRVERLLASPIKPVVYVRLSEIARVALSPTFHNYGDVL